MYTTIKITEKTKALLNKLKLHTKESYEDIILDLIEDRLEMNEEFKRSIEKELEKVKKGEVIPFSKIIKD